PHAKITRTRIYSRCRCGLDSFRGRIIFHALCSLRASSRDVSEMEQSAAPAGGIRNPAPGRPRAAVRPYYEGLSSMTGRGADEGGRKPAGSGEPKAARVCVRKNGPGDRKAAMARREAP